MGDWYLISLSDLLGVDNTATCIEMENGKLVPQYSSILLDNFEVIKKYGIDKILIKQIDINGKKFKEISSNLIIGDTSVNEPLAISISGRKASSNEEIFEYIEYMQGICRILITRFDILNYELKREYELYKTYFERIKQYIEIKKFQRRNSKVIGFPKSSLFGAGEVPVQSGQTELSLLKGKKV